MAKILANKHRPRRLSDIIGQPSVVTTLKNSVESGKIHHAYLFSGSFGCGKTTCSRILAAMINCEKGPTADPCGVCRQCKNIFSSKHSDIIEMDAASGGKIDDIRELKKNVYYAPIAGAKKKIYIIEECLPFGAKIKIERDGKGVLVSIGELVEAQLAAEQLEKCIKISKEAEKAKGYDVKNNTPVFRPIKRYIKIPNDKQMYEIDVRDENGDIKTIKVTGNHKIFANNQYTKTKELKIGDKLILEEGDMHHNGV